MVKKTHAGMMVALITIGFLIVWLYASLTNLAAPASPSSQANATATVPGEALRQLQATENAILTTYGWADRQNGVVRIPIDRAIDLIEQRGLPTLR
jgi:hypothetical protein